MADLGAYQAAAASIYDPQLQSEVTQAGAVRDTTKNALESQKGQVNTNYQSAIDQLTQSVEDQTGQINQLYSQRLGGNFSGLQGNDMGKMFSRANQQTATIASTRVNKLNEITTGQTNADIAYAAGVASLTSRYQGLKSQYANENYGAAVKSEQDAAQRQQEKAQAQANSDREYALSVAKFQSSGSSPSVAQNKAAVQTHVTQGLASGSGRDGNVSRATWNSAMNDYIAGGLGTIRDFWKTYGNYVNDKTKSQYAGFGQR